MNKIIHSSITAERIIDAVEERDTGLGNPGFCAACGADHDTCEPDAAEYQCYECDERAVFGAEMYLIKGLYSK